MSADETIRMHLRKAVDSLIGVESWVDVERILTSLRFFEMKTEAGMVFELAEDLAKAFRRMPEKLCCRRVFGMLSQALRRDLHFIDRHPATLFQCLWNYCWWYDCSERDRHYRQVGTSRDCQERAGVREGTELWRLLERWRAEKERTSPGFRWLRSLRPPRASIGSQGVLTLAGHEGDVSCIAFSRDGRFLASAGNDGTARVWDARSGMQVAVMEGHRDRIGAVALSADGEQALTASNDGDVKLWHRRSGRALFTLRTRCRPSDLSVGFGSDGTFLVASGAYLQRWDRAGRELPSQEIAEGARTTTASPDGHWVAYVEFSEADGYMVCVLELKGGNGVKRFRGHREQIEALAFSPDSRFLASASFDKTVRVWNIRETTELVVCRGHEEWVMSVGWSEDGARLVTGSWDNTTRIWNVETGDELNKWNVGARVDYVAFSPDGKSVGCAAKENVYVWHHGEREDPDELPDHQKAITDMRFSPDGSLLCTIARYEGRAIVWDAAAGTPKAVLIDRCDPRRVRFLPNGERIVTASRDGCIRIWGLDGSLVHRWPTHTVEDDVGLEVSPDGDLIVSWGDWSDRTIRVRHAETGNDIAVFKEILVRQVAFSTDSQLMATGVQGKHVYVWNSYDGRQIAALGRLSEEQGVQCVVFSRDGRRVAAGVNWDIFVWEIASGKELFRFRGSDGTVSSLAFSPDGTRLYALSELLVVPKGGGDGSWSRTTTIWDATRRVPPSRIEGLLDLEAAVAGRPWQAVTSTLETTLLSNQNGVLGAYLPGMLTCVRGSPSGRLWAGAAESHLCIFRFEGAEEVSPTTSDVVALLSPASRLSISKQPKRKLSVTKDLIWVNDAYVLHKATCPVCGSPADLRVYFPGGEARSLDRPIERMRIKCTGKPVSEIDGDCNICTVGSGTEDGLYLFPHTDPAWLRETVRGYLESIGSPFASHQSLEDIPSEADDLALVEWMKVLQQSDVQPSGADGAFSGCTTASTGRWALSIPTAARSALEVVEMGRWASESAEVREHVLRYGPQYLGTQERWDELESLLLDFRFLEAKIVSGMIFDLVEDLCETVARLPSTRSALRLELLKEALLRDVHFIARHPSTLFQCLWNSCWWYDCAEAAQHYDPPESGWPAGGPPWEMERPKMASLLEEWRGQHVDNNAGRVWLRSLRPPVIPLGSGQRAVFRRHEDDVNALLFSADGTILASGSADRTIRFWDVRSGAEQLCLCAQDPVVAIGFSPENDRIVAAGRNTIQIWDIAQEKEIMRISSRDCVCSVGYSHDGRLLAAGTIAGSIRVWKTDDWTEHACLSGHTDNVHSVCFTPAGLLISGSEDDSIRVWDLENERQVACLTGPSARILTMAVSVDGRLAVTGGDNGWILWSIEDWRKLREFRKEIAWVQAIAISRDCGRIATGSSDRTVRVWTAELARQVTCHRGHAPRVSAVAFSPDCKLVASAAPDKTVRIWDAEGGSPVPCLRGHKNDEWFQAAGFTSDGAWLVTRGDWTERAWDVDTGVERNSHQFAKGRGVGPKPPSSWTPCNTRVELAPGPRVESKDSLLECRLVKEKLETTIELSDNGFPIAWFPAVPWSTSSHPSGRIHAGIDGSNLYLFRIEGSPSAPRVACGFCQEVCGQSLYFRGPKQFIGKQCFVDRLESPWLAADASEERCVFCDEPGRERTDTPIGLLCASCAMKGLKEIAFGENLTTWTAAQVLEALTSDIHELRLRLTVLWRFSELVTLVLKQDSECHAAVMTAVVRHLGFQQGNHPFDRIVRQAALDACVSIGRSVLPFLLNAEASDSQLFHENVVQAVGRIAPQDKSVRTFMETSARSSFPEVRECLLESLKGHVTPWAVQIFEGLIGDPVTSVRARLAKTIEIEHGPWAGELLQRLLRDPASSVREVARDKLGPVDIVPHIPFGAIVRSREAKPVMEIVGNYGVYSPDGTTILGSLGARGALGVWDSTTGLGLRAFRLPHWDDLVCSCTWSPDGRRIVAGLFGNLANWDVETGVLLGRFGAHDGGIHDCAYSPDGRRIASCAFRQLQIWDSKTGSLLAALDAHSNQVYACSFSADSRRVVSGSQDESLRVWDGETWTELTVLTGHKGMINCCRWIPLSNRIVSGANDMTLRVWNPDNGQVVLTLEGHDKPVTACDCSPDGRLVISGDSCGNLIVWDTQTGQKLEQFAGHSNKITSVSYSPRGRRFVTSGGKIMRVWGSDKA